MPKTIENFFDCQYLVLPHIAANIYNHSTWLSRLNTVSHTKWSRFITTQTEWSKRL